MNLTRKEIILYTGWYISLITIPSMLTLIHSWVPDLDIPLVSNWRNEISTLCYYSTNWTGTKSLGIYSVLCLVCNGQI